MTKIHLKSNNLVEQFTYIVTIVCSTAAPFGLLQISEGKVKLL